MKMNGLYKSVLNIGFDSIFSMFLINNLDIFVWRIIWDTQDLYLQSNVYLNSFISFLIAYVLILIVKLVQINEINSKVFRDLNSQVESQSKKEAKKKNKGKKWIRHFKIKIFIFMFSFANINHWRGIWNFTNYYTNQSIFGVLIIGILSLFSLVAIRRFCTLISVPFQINKDSYQVAYQIQPCSSNHDYYLSLKHNLHNKIEPNKWQFFLSFLLEYVADCLAVQSWRSLWILMDFYLFPDNQVCSALTSFGFGFIIYVSFAIFNKRINDYFSLNNVDVHESRETRLETYDKLPNYAELNSLRRQDSDDTHSVGSSSLSSSTSKKSLPNLMFNLVTKSYLYLIFFIGYFATVNIWRGIWMLQLAYCYPKIAETNILNQNLLNLIYFTLSILILWNLNSISSLLSRSNCEDTVFASQNNFILKPDHFYTFIGFKKLKAKSKRTTAKIKDFKNKILCDNCTDIKEVAKLNTSIYDCNQQSELALKIPKMDV